MDLLERKGKLALPEVAQIIKHDAVQRLENDREKSNRYSYRQICYWSKQTNLETVTRSTH